MRSTEGARLGAQPADVPKVVGVCGSSTELNGAIQKKQGRIGLRKATTLTGIAGLVWVSLGIFSYAGCGSGNGTTNCVEMPADGGKDLCAFVGTWTATSGTVALTCAGSPSTSQVTGTDVWQLGTTSDLIQPASSGGGCALLADVSGKTATALPNQSCSMSMGSETVNLTISTYTFVLGSGDTTATEMASGTGIASSSGVSETCTYTEMATYTK
jgi:hypothetical protein